MTTFYVKLSKSTDSANFRKTVEGLGAKTQEIYSPFPGRHPDFLELKAPDHSITTKLESFLAKATSIGQRTVEYAGRDFMTLLHVTQGPRYGISRGVPNYSPFAPR